MTSLSYISYLERYAIVQPADGKQTDAVVNMPLVTGDRVDTARGARVEVQLADGSTLWIDEFTTLDFDALAASRENPALRTVLFLQEGTAAIEIPATALGDESVRFDYPNGSLFLSKPGFYRFDLRSGRLHVQAHAGLAELPAGIGSALLRTGQEAWLGDQDRVETSAIPAQVDDFWAWVQERRSPAAAARTAETIGTTTAGRTAALDSYGTWVYVDQYSSWAWRPYVQVGWTPYSHGRWYWTSVGWNWISYEPWGWYPYHYGSWYWDVSFGWAWCWDMVWGPAWVHWMYTPGYIGWCPRGYYDYWYYGHGYHDGGGHHDGGHPGGGPGGGPGHPQPGRWSEVAYDFSGHVRMREVDPRPWNMVPADQFTNARLDRVRVEPGRVLAGAGEDARAYVRSGPLVTAPSRGDVERDLDSGFRGRPDAATDDDLGAIFRRDDQPARTLPAGSSVRAMRTADLVSSGLRRGDAAATDRSGALAGTNDRISAPGGRPMVDFSGAPRSSRTSDGTPAAAAGSVPATGRTRSGGDTGGTGAATRGGSPGTTPADGTPAREPAASPRSSTPPASGGSSTAPRPREVKPAPSGGAAAPAPAPAPRPPGYAARIRSYEGRLSSGGRSWVATGSSSNVTERTYVVPFAGGSRTVHVTSPSASGGRAATSVRGSAPSAYRSYGGGYVPRSPAQATSPGGASSTVSPYRSGGSSTRSYQPAPSGSYSPRSVSTPSGSASPRSAPSSGGSSHSVGGQSSGGSSRSGGGSSSGGSSRSGGGSSSGGSSRSGGGSSSGGSRPSGRR
jgi:hypothetical protein